MIVFDTTIDSIYREVQKLKTPFTDEVLNFTGLSQGFHRAFTGLSHVLLIVRSSTILGVLLRHKSVSELFNLSNGSTMQQVDGDNNYQK